MLGSNSWIMLLVILSIYHITTGEVGPFLALKAQKQRQTLLCPIKRLRHHHFRLALLSSKIYHASSYHHIAVNRTHQAYNFTLSCMQKQKAKEHCLGYLNRFSSKEKLALHGGCCSRNEVVRIEMPDMIA